MEVGFVGTGKMGLPIALNMLKAGHKLTVWDVSQEATKELEALGAARASSLEALANNVHVTFISLPNESIVEKIVCGDGGLLSGAHSGDTIFDLSTVSPSSTRRIAEYAATRNVTLIDAPVSGSVTGAASGTLTLMIGTTKEVTRPYESVLTAIGTTFFYLGERGLGNTLKLINNLVALSNQVALCEAMALADRLGISRQVVGDVLGKSSANSFILEKKLTDIVKHDYRPGFFVDLAYKDLSLAVEVAEQAGARIELGKQTHRLYGEASIAGFGKLDGSGILALLEPASKS